MYKVNTFANLYCQLFNNKQNRFRTIVKRAPLNRLCVFISYTSNFEYEAMHNFKNYQMNKSYAADRLKGL